MIEVKRYGIPLEGLALKVPSHIDVAGIIKSYEKRIEEELEDRFGHPVKVRVEVVETDEGVALVPFIE